MSYEIVRSLKIDTKQNKVYLTTASNNVFPKTYERWEDERLSKILIEKGKETVELELMKLYESGNLQGGSNKYTRALKILSLILWDEYKYFCWRCHNAPYGSEERKEEDSRRESKEFDELLMKALNYKKSKKRYVISKKQGETTYYGKCGSRRLSWYPYKSVATKYEFKEEGESYLTNFSYLGNVEVKELGEVM